MGSFNLNEREVLLVKVEELMAKQFVEPAYIAKTLNVTYETAKDYIEAINTRWNARTIDIDKTRKKRIRQAEEFMKQSWIDHEQMEGNCKIGAMNVGIKALGQAGKYEGLEISSTVSSKEELEGFLNEFTEEIQQDKSNPETPVATEQLAKESIGIESQVQDDSGRQEIGQN